MRDAIEAIRNAVLRDPMTLAVPLGIFVITMGAGYLVRALILRALSAWCSRTGTRAGRVLTEALRGPMLIWTLILAAHLALQGSQLPPHIARAGAKVLLILWIFSLTLMCVRIAGDLIRFYGAQAPGALPVTTLTQNLAQIAIIIIGLLFLLDELHVSITPILTALGVGGLAVALALQDTLSNLFGGFYVAVAGQVRLSDYIKLNTGEEGYVSDIGWRSTTIRSLSNNMIIVPNAKLAQAIVTNFYLPDKRIPASLQVGVSYRSDPDQIERMLLEIAVQGTKDIPGMLSDPAPSVSFDPGFGEYSLGFSVNYQVAEFADQFGVRNELRKRIFRRFRTENIEIPFPRRDIRIEGQEAWGAPAAKPEA